MPITMGETAEGCPLMQIGSIGRPAEGASPERATTHREGTGERDGTAFARYLAGDTTSERGPGARAKDREAQASNSGPDDGAAGDARYDSARDSVRNSGTARATDHEEPLPPYPPAARSVSQDAPGTTGTQGEPHHPLGHPEGRSLLTSGGTREASQAEKAKAPQTTDVGRQSATSLPPGLAAAPGSPLGGAELAAPNAQAAAVNATSQPSGRPGSSGHRGQSIHRPMDTAKARRDPSIETSRATLGKDVADGAAKVTIGGTELPRSAPLALPQTAEAPATTRTVLPSIATAQPNSVSDPAIAREQTLPRIPGTGRIQSQGNMAAAYGQPNGNNATWRPSTGPEARRSYESRTDGTSILRDGAMRSEGAASGTAKQQPPAQTPVPASPTPELSVARAALLKVSSGNGPNPPMRPVTAMAGTGATSPQSEARLDMPIKSLVEGNEPGIGKLTATLPEAIPGSRDPVGARRAIGNGETLSLSSAADRLQSQPSREATNLAVEQAAGKATVLQNAPVQGAVPSLVTAGGSGEPTATLLGRNARAESLPKRGASGGGGPANNDPRTTGAMSPAQPTVAAQGMSAAIAPTLPGAVQGGAPADMFFAERANAEGFEPRGFEPRVGAFPSDIGTTAQARSDGPRGEAIRISAQIVDAMRQTPGAAVLDVSIHPEELGRLRLVFAPAETGLAVTLQADRPETLDLLRRHVELLQADLREQGFGDVSFRFGAQGEGREQPSSGTGSDSDRTPAGLATAGPEGQTTAAPEPGPEQDRGRPDGGLDLRL